MQPEEMVEPKLIWKVVIYSLVQAETLAVPAQLKA